jgi:hypothetical protein
MDGLYAAPRRLGCGAIVPSREQRPAGGGRGASETPSPSVAESCVIPAVAAHAIERARFGSARSLSLR